MALTFSKYYVKDSEGNSFYYTFHPLEQKKSIILCFECLDCIDNKEVFEELIPAVNSIGDLQFRSKPIAIIPINHHLFPVICQKAISFFNEESERNYEQCNGDRKRNQKAFNDYLIADSYMKKCMNLLGQSKLYCHQEDKGLYYFINFRTGKERILSKDLEKNDIHEFTLKFRYYKDQGFNVVSMPKKEVLSMAKEVTDSQTAETFMKMYDGKLFPELVDQITKNVYNSKRKAYTIGYNANQLLMKGLLERG